MRWFDKWINKKVRQSLQTPIPEFAEKEASLSVPSQRRLNRSGMNFTIFVADSGGYIVEYTSHDMRNGKSDSRLHIISDEAQLTEKLSHIITIETLRA